MLGSTIQVVVQAPSGRLHPRRRGGLMPLFLVMIGLLMALIALAVDGANLWSARLEMQSSVDAASLAAAARLADDRLLANLPETMNRVVEYARAEAQTFAAQNPVGAQPLLLDPNPEQHPEGDIVFGFYDPLDGVGFQPAQPQDWVEPTLNAVRVVGQRTRERGNPIPLWFSGFQGRSQGDVAAGATAYLDRDVVGFKPLAEQTIPLMPIALLSDPAAEHEASWEFQTVRPTWTAGDPSSPWPLNDQYVFDHLARRFIRVGVDVDRGNRLPEMEARIPLMGAAYDDVEPRDEPNGCWLIISVVEENGLLRQISLGIGAEDLADLGGELILGEGDWLPLQGQEETPASPAALVRRRWAMLNEVAARGEPRIWPIYRSWQPTEEDQPAIVGVTGFVAARLIGAEVRTSPYAHLYLRLEPCQMTTATAVTDPSRRGAAFGAALPNPYIGKVRLIP